jgi:ABC-type multidrug transport system permease subunit
MSAEFLVAVSIAVISVLGLLAFSGLGFALACVIKNDSVINDVINAIALPVALLSGMFFSTDAFPAPLRWLSSVLPSTLMVDAIRETALYGSSLAHLSMQIGGLLLWAIGGFAVSLTFFRWHR